MNDKKDGIIGAVIVGVILTIAQIFIQRGVDRGDSTATNLATLTERVSNLSDQVEKLTQQPYARREDLVPIENRVTGLEQRVGDIERSRGQRSR